MPQISNNSKIPGVCAVAAPGVPWYPSLHLEEYSVLAEKSYAGHPGSYRFRVLGPIEYTWYNCT